MNQYDRNYSFGPSWFSAVPDLLLLFMAVGMVTLPIKILKILTTKLSLEDNTLYGEIGILRKDIQSSPVKHIQSVRVDRSLFGRILGYGDVIITTAGHGYTYKFMAHPEKIREAINNNIRALT